MTTNYLALAAQIEKLRSQAEIAKKKERPGVISRIKAAIAVYGLTAQDLGLGVPSGKTKSAKAETPTSKPKSAAGQAKFRDEAGNTWSGKGPRPAWLKTALESGVELQSLEVNVPAKTRGTTKPTKKTKVGASQAKYRDGAGNVWSGRGPRPSWLKAAIADGATLESFAVKKRKLSEVAGILKPAPGTHVTIEEMRR